MYGRAARLSIDEAAQCLSKYYMWQYIHPTGYIQTLELELHYLRLFGTLVTYIWAGEVSSCGEGGALLHNDVNPTGLALWIF